MPTPVRAQLLATEHWSLLATRGMTWSEVMGRITVHLTISSAALVVLALVTQATGFGVAFHVLSIGLTSAVLALGTLRGSSSQRQQRRRRNHRGHESATRRLRPDGPRHRRVPRDEPPRRSAGLMATYTMGMRRSTISHVIGSTSMFINIVNAVVAGTLGALIADAAAGNPVATALAGAVAGVAYLAIVFDVARRSFAHPPLEARFPTPDQNYG